MHYYLLSHVNNLRNSILSAEVFSRIDHKSSYNLLKLKEGNK